jgi:hypothetical protein
MDAPLHMIAYWNPPRLSPEAEGCILDPGRWRIAVKKPWMVYGARALVLLWAGFWVYFFVGSVMVEPTPGHVVAVGSAVLLVFAILALVPCRWEAAGGLLLVVMSWLIGAAYAITAVVFTGPPLVAGILFLLHHRIVSTRTGAA